MSIPKHPPSAQHHHAIFPATTDDVRVSLDQVFRWLEPLALPAEDAGTIELVLAEVLNNIVEHAYRHRADGKIDLTIFHKAGGLDFRVRDEGCAMPDGQLPEGKRMSLDLDLNSLPEGGFGWFLIRDLAQNVTYCREDAKNCLSFRIPVGSAALPSDQPAES